MLQGVLMLPALGKHWVRQALKNAKADTQEFWFLVQSVAGYCSSNKL